MKKQVANIFEFQNDDCAFKYKSKRLYPGYRDSAQSYDELKFVHIMSGSGIWSINGRDYPVGKDDVVLLCRMDERYMADVVSETALVTEQIEFLPMTIYPMQHCANFFFSRSADFSNVLRGESEDHRRILNCFDELRAELTRPSAYQKEAIIHQICGMVLASARICGGEASTPTRCNDNCYQIVCCVMVYIKEHLQEALSRNELARKFGISPSYLSRIFREYSGICLQNYIVQCRVQRAISLLKQGDVSVLDAALESGFTSTSGFYRAFSSVTGMKPRDVRSSV